MSDLPLFVDLIHCLDHLLPIHIMFMTKLYLLLVGYLIHCLDLIMPVYDIPILLESVLLSHVHQICSYMPILSLCHYMFMPISAFLCRSC